MSKIRRHWFSLLLVSCVLTAAIPYLVVYAQVSPQIQGAGAPSNPCNNGGQQYVDQTNHVIYQCPSSGSNWVNIGLGLGTTILGGNTLTTNTLPKATSSNQIGNSSLSDNGTTLTSTEPWLAPNGSASAPAYSWTNETNSGVWRPNSGLINVAILGNNVWQFGATSVTGPIVFALSSTGLAGNAGFTAQGADIIGIGNGGQGDTSALVRYAAFQSAGATFTASGCANSTLVGGATAGTYKSVTGGSCTVTITMGSSASTATGWTCDAHDLTTVADANNVTMGSSNATTANLVEGTVAANDIIAFKCVGY